MSWLITYLLVVLYCLFIGGIITRWEIKHATLDADKEVKLSSLLIALFFMLVPVLNIVLAFWMTWYFIDEIASRIVVFGKKK